MDRYNLFLFDFLDIFCYIKYIKIRGLLMRSFLETIKNLFASENKEVGIEGALRGYDPMQKAYIVNLYNCYGIDAVIKYLN